MSKPTVLITGCTKGSIGYSLAREFANRNYQVYATTRGIQSMDDLGYHPNITLLSLDVTSRESLLAAHARINQENHGKLDILYHNAGYRSLAMATETSRAEALKIFDANFFGIVEMNEIFTDLVVAARGKIVFTGSVSGYTPHPSQSVYCASKAALELYARTLRIEMQPFKVRVVFVNTAAVKTAMSSERVSLAPGSWLFIFCSGRETDCAEDSRYQYLEKKINESWFKLEGETMSPEAYAQTVVNKVTKSNPAEVIWCGTGAFTVWLVEALGIHWAYPRAFSKMFGLNTPAPSLKQ
jgi:1-acylglycerone phosphate reductase